LVFNNKGTAGVTKVEITKITAAVPSEEFTLDIAGPAVTKSEKYSLYDVNRDGKIDLADVASAALFFMKIDTDDDWLVEKEYKSLDGTFSVFVSPERCDVNGDGVVDIEDLILILVNIPE
jgi:hypothetical protein